MINKPTSTKIIDYLSKHDAAKVSLFGSYAKNKENQHSDLDILVLFNKRKSLLELVRLERELTELIGIKVDLLTEKSLSPFLAETIKKEQKIIYERSQQG
jgi:predicted nucleotidyltransferase